MPTLTTNRCDFCRRLDLPTRLTPGGVCCDSCFRSNYFICDGCGEIRERYGCRIIGGLTLCCQCQPNTDCWDVTPSPVSIATYEKLGSKRKYGIELETSYCHEYRPLKGKTLFGAKFDCSVSGMEFISPILYGDEGLAEIDSLLTFADANNWTAHDECGYHLHIDVRDENPVQMCHIAYGYCKTYNAWRGLVSEYRATENNYCHASTYSASQIRNHTRSFVRFCYNSPRYNWFNLASYDRHKTFEVRLHDGTLHAKTVNYWIMAHMRFTDAIRNMRYDDLDAAFSGNPEENFAALCRIWDRGGQEISGFYRRRFRVHA